MSKSLISTTEKYRIDTEDEVNDFIAEEKEKANEEGYTIKAYSSTVKQKKKKGEIIDEACLVTITKEFVVFFPVEVD